MPILYLVGTPIGNLEDISLRALRILGEVGLIAAEDTRKSGRLLKHYDIRTSLVSFHDYSSPQKINKLVRKLESQDVALISDAGMPGLSDPGYRLVRAAVDAGVRVEPIPGPSAAVAVLVSSGLPTDRYLYLGFLSRQPTGRRTALEEISRAPYTLLFFEAPHRLIDFLKDALQILGDRQACIGREITKLHEEIWRGSLSQALAHFEQGIIKGEITVVITGSSEMEEPWKEELVRRALQELLHQGVARKDAAASVAEDSGWRKRQLYKIALELEL